MRDDTHADEWEREVTSTENVLIVDRRQVNGGTTPAIPIHHKGHPTGAALELQRNNNMLTSTPELAEYPTRIQMFLIVWPRQQDSEPIIERPPKPYWSYNITCARCGQRMSVRGIKLLRLALETIDAPAEDRATRPFKITLT